MDKLITFLEDCGRRAELATSGEAALRSEAEHAGLSETEVSMLAERRRAGIEVLLGSSPRMTCLVFPAKDEPGQPDDDGDGRDEPSDEPKEPSSHRRAA